MLLQDLPIELLSNLCAYLSASEVAGLFATLCHRLQEKLSHSSVIPYLHHAQFAGDPHGPVRYLLRSIRRPDLIEYSYGTTEFDLVVASRPYGLKLVSNSFPHFFDVKLPRELELLRWNISDHTGFPKIQRHWDEEDELCRRFEDTLSDSDGEEEALSEPRGEEDGSEGENDSTKAPSESSSQPDSAREPPSEPSEPPSRPPEIADPEPRITVASASRDFWPSSLTELDLSIRINLLCVWTELVLNLPPTVLSLRMKPVGTWSRVNYGEGADFFIEDAWVATPSLTSLSISHPEIRSRFADSAPVQSLLAQVDPIAGVGELSGILFSDGPIPANLETLRLTTLSRQHRAFLATNIMPSLRNLKLKLEELSPVEIPFSIAKHFAPPGVTSLIFPGCIDLSIVKHDDPKWQEVLPSSLTALTLKTVANPQNYRLIHSDLGLEQLAFNGMYHSYQELEEMKVFSVRQVPKFLTDLNMALCTLFPGNGEDRLSMLPPTLKRLRCKEEAFSHIEAILDRFDSPDFQFISSAPIPAFQSLYRPIEKSIDPHCNLGWLWRHISQTSPTWTELSTSRLLELLNSKFRGRVSLSIEDSNLIYSSELATQGSLLETITSLDWRTAQLGGLSRPEVVHIDIMRLLPNLTNLNISLLTPRHTPTVLRIAGSTLPAHLTSLEITHNGPGYYAETLPALPPTLTSLKWYLFARDYVSVPRFILPHERQFMVLDTPSFLFEYKELFQACHTQASLIRAVISAADDDFYSAVAAFDHEPILGFR